MLSSELKNRWEDLRNQQGLLQRVDSTHPLDFFVGISTNGNYQLVLITKIEPAQIRSSKVLEIEKNIRKDGRWATQIALLDDNNKDIFAKLCMDLIDSSAESKDEAEGLTSVTKRFLAWQKLFETMHETLPVSAIKGLIGELVFAAETLSNVFSWDEIMDAWQGPDGADRDYVFMDKWFEVKSIATGKSAVQISSLDQLDTKLPGYITLFNVDESSSTDPLAIPVSAIVNRTRNLLACQPSAAQKYERKLISVGYMDKKQYDNMYFSYSNPTFYEVNSDFPKVTRDMVHHGIIDAKYKIDLAAIEEYKKEESAIWNL